MTCLFRHFFHSLVKGLLLKDFLNKKLLQRSGQWSLSVPSKMHFRCWQAFSCTWKVLSLLPFLLSSLSWQQLPQTEVRGHWYDFALSTIFIIWRRYLGTANFSKFMSKCLCCKQLLLFQHRTDLPWLKGPKAPYRFSLTVLKRTPLFLRTLFPEVLMLLNQTSVPFVFKWLFQEFGLYWWCYCTPISSEVTE